MEESSPSPLILRWASILCGLSVPFTFFIALRLPRGFLRLLALLPFLLAFPVLHGLLPSPIGRGALAFTLCWDCPCKLLLLCFGRPANLPTCSFPHFLLAMLLPARVLKGVTTTTTTTSSSSSSSSHHLPTAFSHISALLFYFNLSHAIPHALSYPSFFLPVYLSIDLPYRLSAVLMHVVLGVELHPAFNKPWLSTSLTQFWGNRWNLAANSLLRQTVYNPLVELLSSIKRVPELHQPKGASDLKLWVRIVAVCVTFSASGLIHELIYFNLTQAKSPSWEVTAFFALQGMAVSAEITLRRISVIHIHPLFSKVPRHLKVFLTLGFLSATAKWLFLPPLVNSHFFFRCSSEHLRFQNWAARLVLQNLRTRGTLRRQVSMHQKFMMTSFD